jgi:GNAT superfamily N-acetyltransferase
VRLSLGAIVVRPLDPRDSLDALTHMLHRAYRPLAARGWNYTAATQGERLTRIRCAMGRTLVAVDRGRLVGTVTLRTPRVSLEHPWFRDPGIPSFEQLAVDPTHQGLGLGDVLRERVEEEARSAGAREIACDTAEPARHLVDWYLRRGYRVVDRVRWRGKAYVSVVLSKRLAARR